MLIHTVTRHLPWAGAPMSAELARGARTANAFASHQVRLATMSSDWTAFACLNNSTSLSRHCYPQIPMSAMGSAQKHSQMQTTAVSLRASSHVAT